MKQNAQNLSPKKATSKKMTYYRGLKGRFTSKNNYIELITNGEITYSPKTTSDQRSPTKFMREEKIQRESIVPRDSTYKTQIITLPNKKKIYMVYRNTQERQHILEQIINSTESPKQRQDLQEITDLDKDNLRIIKEGKNRKGKKIRIGKEKTVEYKDLNTFIDYEEAQLLK